MLASPVLSELPVQHRQHILPNGKIQFPRIPATRGEAVVLSTAWVTDPSLPQFAMPDQPAQSSSESKSVPAKPTQPSPAAPIILDPDFLSQHVREEILGQDEAVGLLCKTASEHIAKVEPRHPLVLVAVGPTGTGKSESVQVLVTTLGELYPDAGYGMVRVNLSQYKEEHRISELFGSPPGYVGYNTKTNLVSALSKSPRQIILWDELEKAHPRVITALLSLLDNGSLSLPAPLEDGTFEIDCRLAT